MVRLLGTRASSPLCSLLVAAGEKHAAEQGPLCYCKEQKCQEQRADFA